MTHTRTLTGTIHKPTGDPWAAFRVDFALTPTAHMSHATLPATVASVTTEEDGTFSVALEVGVQYEARLAGAYLTQGFSTTYPPGTRFKFVLPDGAGSISLEEVVALNAPPDGSGSFASALSAAVATLSTHTAELADHEARVIAAEQLLAELWARERGPIELGDYYDSSALGGLQQAQSLSANQLYFAPFWVGPTGFAADRIGVFVNTGAAGSARLGWFDADPLTWRPNAMQDDIGVVSLSSTGLKEITISKTFAAASPHRLIWLAYLANVTTDIYGATSVAHHTVFGAPSWGVWRQAVGWSVACPYGALPASAAGHDNEWHAPLIYLRAA